MKEATGELNMTVVTVLIIAALAGIAATIIVPMISGGIRQSSCASTLGLKNDEVSVTKTSEGKYQCCKKGDTTGCVILENDE